ncbi:MULTISPECIES: hypothetical protein [Rhizobium]|uniref:Uncharacterized protein n=1 Tax=Rhizobium aouanii TaxID=3118145 RepID=A0ABU8CJX0_9HYPH|nr:hypothetical protein [Rhizobium acaciae]MCW1410819.1 hypothetical protein [Rhizobium acaciae]MCW1742882.1 hypothetical protein [Rhizobium acaciae]MCW1750078.1 hypothetical protein [Rhizobium acaciae]
MTKISPSNLAAQLNYRGRGNPWNTQPVTAISNCFPGLEFDFRVIWRRMFEGLLLMECHNLVIGGEGPLAALEDHRLLGIVDPERTDDEAPLPLMVQTSGATMPGRAGNLGNLGNKNGVSFMEWSNSLARIFDAQGRTVVGYFTPDKSLDEVLLPTDKEDLASLKKVELTVRKILDVSAVDGQRMATISRSLIEPGELSQGLCSPWQNDYRECACYYWAASRPDYVNVVDGPDGVSTGDDWMAVERPAAGGYVLDDRSDSSVWSYDQLFQNWQGYLKFVVGGSEAQDAEDRADPS